MKKKVFVMLLIIAMVITNIPGIESFAGAVGSSTYKVNKATGGGGGGGSDYWDAQAAAEFRIEMPTINEMAKELKKTMKPDQYKKYVNPSGGDFFDLKALATSTVTVDGKLRIDATEHVNRFIQNYINSQVMQAKGVYALSKGGYAMSDSSKQIGISNPMWSITITNSTRINNEPKENYEFLSTIPGWKTAMDLMIIGDESGTAADTVGSNVIPLIYEFWKNSDNASNNTLKSQFGYDRWQANKQYLGKTIEEANSQTYIEALFSWYAAHQEEYGDKLSVPIITWACSCVWVDQNGNMAETACGLRDYILDDYAAYRGFDGYSESKTWYKDWCHKNRDTGVNPDLWSPSTIKLNALWIFMTLTWTGHKTDGPVETTDNLIPYAYYNTFRGNWCPVRKSFWDADKFKFNGKSVLDDTSENVIRFYGRGYGSYTAGHVYIDNSDETYLEFNIEAIGSPQNKKVEEIHSDNYQTAALDADFKIYVKPTEAMQANFKDFSDASLKIYNKYTYYISVNDLNMNPSNQGKDILAAYTPNLLGTKVGGTTSSSHLGTASINAGKTINPVDSGYKDYNFELNGEEFLKFINEGYINIHYDVSTIKKSENADKTKFYFTKGYKVYIKIVKNGELSDKQKAKFTYTDTKLDKYFEATPTDLKVCENIHDSMKNGPYNFSYASYEEPNPPDDKTVNIKYETWSDTHDKEITEARMHNGSPLANVYKIYFDALSSEDIDTITDYKTNYNYKFKITPASAGPADGSMKNTFDGGNKINTSSNKNKVIVGSSSVNYTVSNKGVIEFTLTGAQMLKLLNDDTYNSCVQIAYNEQVFDSNNNTTEIWSTHEYKVEVKAIQTTAPASGAITQCVVKADKVKDITEMADWVDGSTKTKQRTIIHRTQPDNYAAANVNWYCDSTGPISITYEAYATPQNKQTYTNGLHQGYALDNTFKLFFTTSSKEMKQVNKYKDDFSYTITIKLDNSKLKSTPNPANTNLKNNASGLPYLQIGNTTVGTFSNAGKGSYSLELTGQQFYDLLNKEGKGTCIRMDYLQSTYSSEYTNPSVHNIYTTHNYTVDITMNKLGEKDPFGIKSVNADKIDYLDTAYSGNGHIHDTVPGQYSASWVSFTELASTPTPTPTVTPTPTPVIIVPEDEPWEIHSTTPVAYAEVIANMAGQDSDGRRGADWNVANGIPSTENVSVAGGGQLYKYDLGGMIEFQGKVYGKSASDYNTANDNKGESHSDPAATRTIHFEVTVVDIWGSSNPRCTLSCSGHKIINGGNSYSNSDTKSDSKVASGGNSVSVSVHAHLDAWTCSVCGQTVPAQDAYDSDSASSTAKYDKDGNFLYYTTKTASASASVSQTHNCKWHVDYNCSTDTLTLTKDGSDSLATETHTSQKTSNNQRYNLTSLTVTNGSETKTGTLINNALLCEGYTVGYGCKSSHPQNCVHRGTATRKFDVVEQVEMYAYRTILDSRIYGLSQMNVTDYNNKVITTSSLGGNLNNPKNRSSSSANLEVALWRENGGYKSGMVSGRFWFTQFLNPDYKSSQSGWISTSIRNQAGSNIGYWLGDVEVKIKVYADSKVANYEDDVSAINQCPTHINNCGNTYNRYRNDAQSYDPLNVIDDSTPENICSDHNSYKGHNGDCLNSEEITKLCCQVINEWQWANDSSQYTINVISDNCAVGYDAPVHDDSTSIANAYQTLVGDVYKVDNGIHLFDCGFTANNEKHYRVHVDSRKPTEIASLYRGNAFSVADTNGTDNHMLQSGYNGKYTLDFAEKYNSICKIDTGTSATKYHSYDTVPTVREKNATITYWLYNCAGGNNTSAESNRKYFDNGRTVAIWKAESIGRPYENRVRYCSTGAYSTLIGQDFGSNKAGRTEVKLKDTTTVKEYKFQGHYNEYVYPYMQNNDTSIMHYISMNGSSSPSQYDGNDLKYYVTDSGPNNIKAFTYYGKSYSYYTPFVISNIKLKTTAPNGVYNEPVTVKMKYIPYVCFKDDMFSYVNSPTDGADYTIKCKYSSDPVWQNSAGKNNVVNDIVIHDPISVQYCAVAGNGIKYASYVDDNTKEDLRSSLYNGSAYKDLANTAKPNYVVMGNEFHIWWSDFGDFADNYYTKTGSKLTGYDVYNASWNRGLGSNQKSNNSSNGEILVNSAGQSIAQGYVDDIDTAKWVKNRFITFPFPVMYYDLSGNPIVVGEGVEIDLNTVPSLDNNGNRVNSTYASSKRIPPNDLVAFMNANDNIDQYPKYGLDFQFYCLESSIEQRDARIKVRSVSINNPYTDPMDDPERNLARYNLGSSIGRDYEAYHNVTNTYKIDVVGRIGNLAIEDVTDFRFSNFFKNPTTTWNIKNVIKNVNSAYPRNVVSSPLDIIKNNATTYKHGTQSVTAITYNNEHFLGKAGNFVTLPLAAYVNANIVPEFRKQQMRIGYKAYIDVETMGNYYGINTTDEVGTPLKGPTKPGQADNRSYVMKITPYYVLYDYEHDTYHKIDLYYGSNGDYKKYWTPALSYVSGDNVTGLVNNLPEDMNRWNTDTAEKINTNNVLDTQKYPKISAFTGTDYIGTAGNIVLDQYDRTFIGSSMLYGAIKYDFAFSLFTNGNSLGRLSKSIAGYPYSNTTAGYAGRTILSLVGDKMVNSGTMGTNELDFANQGQRWYFNLGLPSSTKVVPTGTASKDVLTANKNFKKQHPNSVILVYADIVVKGTTWELTYDYNIAMDGDIKVTLFKDNKDIPDSVSNKSTVKKVIEPYNSSDSGVTRDKTPLYVMDAWMTSSDDWATYGTH